MQRTWDDELESMVAEVTGEGHRLAVSGAVYAPPPGRPARRRARVAAAAEVVIVALACALACAGLIAG